MSLSKEQADFALDVARLITYINEKGYSVTFGETWRTPEQAALNAKQGKGIAKSLHIQRLAVDLNLFSPDGEFLTDGKYHEPFGKYWESLDSKNRWGGKFKIMDGNHYERNAA